MVSRGSTCTRQSDLGVLQVLGAAVDVRERARMAGGGVRGGTVYGATDDFGFKAVEQPTSVHDLHATILRLLGFDHERLTYRYSGRDFRLTDVHGRVIDGILA